MLDRPVFSDVIEKAISYLRSVGVYIEQVHAESAPGQFEVVLPAAPTVQAVDNLLFVREVIASVATASGYRMTLHPKPFSMAAGNAAHVHMSISSPGGDDPAVYESFYAGILEHLRGICAFTYSHPASYERVLDGCWAGGRWVAWGTQNRETPLRKVKDSHWELKCMDGMANPYLAIAAVLSAGVYGIRHGLRLGQKDCPRDPALLSPSQKTSFGIANMLPANLSEALSDLRTDTVLRDVMGPELVERYIAVKGVEIKNYESMGVEERRQWVLSHY
jgi:glutamine synthetase